MSIERIKEVACGGQKELQKILKIN